MSSRSHWITRVPALLEFGVFYLKEVVLSNLRVARDVISPKPDIRPGFLELDVRGMTDRQLLVTANLISMTPGTLSIDVDADRERLLVHGMYVDDPLKEAGWLEEAYLRRVRHVF